MPKFRYTEWQNVASEVQTLRLTVLDQLNSFKEAQQAFQSAGKLSGGGILLKVILMSTQKYQRQWGMP